MKLKEAKESDIINTLTGMRVEIERTAYNYKHIKIDNGNGGVLVLEADYGFKAHIVTPPEMVDSWKLSVVRHDGFARTQNFDKESDAADALESAKANGEVKEAVLEKLSVPKQD